jgi:peptidoglycan/LPS O-acetylase OafA/YrhL
MNDQFPINEPEPLDRREERLADSPRTGTWTAGLILILLGGMFLMRNMGTFNIPLKNWWALFILIPAVGAFETAMRLYRHAGNQFTIRVRSSLFLGCLLILIALGFLFNISWTFFGPVIIILVGIGILLNYSFSNRE